MANNEWKDVQERMPEAADADKTGRVLAWHALNGCMIMGWFLIGDNRFVTHWRRLPEAPEGADEMARIAIWGLDPRFK